MASIRKIGKRYRVEISKNLVRDSRYFRTKQEASAWAIEREAEIISRHSYGVASGSKKTFSDAILRYKTEILPTHKSPGADIVAANGLLSHKISTIKISSLSSDDIAAWRDERALSVSSSTVNRQLNTLSSILTYAVKELRWVTHNVCHDVRRPRQPPHRDKRISGDDIQAVINALGYAPCNDVTQRKQCVALFFLVALETAMRLGEICSMRASTVFLDDRYVLLTDTKNGDTRKVPLSTRAAKLISEYLVSGLTITSMQAGALYRKYCNNAGIKDLHFHDTRHEAITRLSKKLGVLELAKMVGHRDTKSLMIYYNPTPEEIARRLD